ncbi:acetyltransferase [Cytobacillus kochii]|uniref:GNAT family N-acetyltransferase n=1 Tax=Cytobacillus sp. FSL R7-0696 TaxID=2921691 RepID=UPI001CD24CB1|nr:GNAT family N-acetyltransferase [Cytobacillus kochii]MCA1026028.1 acetyltransferase [Cytobacillus kochii]MDM5207621.1 GNAT family N-acetyltransferase [Cytobacillus kochii]
MKENDLYIRKMSKNDYLYMRKWLSTKEVLTFYGDVNEPFSLEMVKEKYGPRIDGEINVLPFIVELKDQPIGFMQYYQVDNENEYFGFGDNELIYGIDQFIGEPMLFGKGIGTRMVKLFVKYIAQRTEAKMVILDTATNNHRAIACYEKVGFTKVRKMNKDSNWLMVYPLK